MIKLLIDSDILLGASQGDQPAHTLLGICKNNSDVQGWVLANVTADLVNAGVEAGDINDLLIDLAQIPINALLNEHALESELEFPAALLNAAGPLFKADRVVSNRFSDLAGSIQFVNCSKALALVESDSEPGKVNFMNLNLGLHPIFNRVDGWFTDIIQNTAFAGGKHVDAFEQEFAKYCGTNYAIGVSNGTDALRFALIAMGIGDGDEIITVPNTFIATTEIMSQLGAKPVFVDVLEGTYNLNPDLIEDKITGNTKAIVPVHLYGQVAEMDRIMEIADKHGLLVLEDSCQAHGAVYKGKRAGSFGNAAAFSMYPGKNLGAYGEAGCIVTNDKDIDDVVRCLREHGQSKKYYHRMEGYNGRMDNLQAAALRGKLPFLDGWNQKRRERAKQYLEHLNGIPELVLPEVSDFSAHVFHVFVILVPDSAALSAYLREKDIYTAFHYPVPLHLQDAYRGSEVAEGHFPVSEKCAKSLISLPMYPELTKQEVDKVCQEIRQFYSG